MTSFSYIHIKSSNTDVDKLYNFFLQEGLSPINLIVEDQFHRASPGGTGGVKTIGNYASVNFWIGIYRNYIFYSFSWFLTAHLVIHTTCRY
jgi:hypothetical protein